MFFNYLKSAFRNLKKTRIYSLINILGLTLGMTICLLLLHYVNYEKSYDSFHQNADRIYRIRYERIDSNDNAVRFASCAPPAGKLLREEFKEIEKLTRVFFYQASVSFEDVKFYEDRIFYVDPEFAEIFDFEFSYGDDYMLAWGHTGMYTYALMREDVDIAAFEAKLPAWINDKVPWLKDYQMTMNLPLQPLRDIHLTSHYMQEYEANGNKSAVTYLTVIAFFIIVMAWVNYINLSTARSMTRAKEVGMRKTIGASRRQLAAQFFIETILINVIVLALTIILLEAARPLFNNLTDMPLPLRAWQQPWFWPVTAALFLVGMIFSGLYPVLAMSSFQPIVIFASDSSSAAKGLNLRKGLIIFQFIMALVLLICTFTIYQQISFMLRQDLGFNSDQVMVFKSPRVRPENIEERFRQFKEILTQNAQIFSACHVTEVPGRQLYWDAGDIHKAGADETEGKNYQNVGVDYHFLDVFDVKMVAGRMFSPDFGADTSAIILNETAVQFMGWDNVETAVGGQVDYWGRILTIIGVMQNYHQQSPKAAYEPTLYLLRPIGRGVRGQFALKVQSDNMRETMQQIEQKYAEYFPGNPFEYFFLDDYFNWQYQSDELFGRVFTLFAFLALIITALGILGMSAFNVARRTKEIGIRKVLGSSVTRILYLLSKEYIKWVLIASLFAWPLAWLAMRGWLQGFATRVNIGLWTFVVSALIALVIALVTVSFQAWKAAMANPVETLRYE